MRLRAPLAAVKERAMAENTDTEIASALDEFCNTFLHDELDRLAEAGFEAPLLLAIMDKHGTAATAQIDEDWRPVECVAYRMAETPFTVAIVDCNHKGATIEFLKYVN
jgi:hypothetical protein